MDNVFVVIDVKLFDIVFCNSWISINSAHRSENVSKNDSYFISRQSAHNIVYSICGLNRHKKKLAQQLLNIIHEGVTTMSYGLGSTYKYIPFKGSQIGILACGFLLGALCH